MSIRLRRLAPLALCGLLGAIAPLGQATGGSGNPARGRTAMDRVAGATPAASGSGQGGMMTTSDELADAAEVPREWLTPAEAAGYEATPSYAETISYIRRLAPRLPEMRLGFYGTSAAGRRMPLVVLSKTRAFTPESARQAGVPVVLIQNGIHAGEIDGKDACLLLLRDLALGRRRELLDAGTLLILPIYNVDGHERVSPYNRPNQDGPRRGMGWRTTDSGLDLNRDHLKLSSPEARALVALVGAWRPHLHVDNHVTDGVEHDWVLTWSWAEAPQLAAPVDAWLRSHLPAALAATERAGHRTGPYVDLKDPADPAKGFSSWVALPRYSTGYFPLLNRPSVLVETHSYKPYRARVLATRDFLAALLGEVAKDPAGLVRAVAGAEAAEVALGQPGAAASKVVVAWEESAASDSIRLPLYATETVSSLVTGQPLLRYHRGEVHELVVPWFHGSQAARTTDRPRGYLVLPGWPQIEQRLRGHGLRVEQLTAPAELEVETLRLAEPKPAGASYQGLTRITAAAARHREHRHIPAGTLWIPASQPDFEVAVQLLEPEAPDSLLSWGLLSSVFESKEGISPWVLEEQAKSLLAKPEIARAWQAALADPKFAADPQARHLWWYRQTPHWDDTLGLLPYFPVMAPPAGLKTRPW